ncbi:valine--tRNA ligase [Mycoplasma todarodis]|uniref:Valine--tRNA ligase n=2 Tax=Mycoplasma todarodis TaxID=1937191 RepID=A0A4V2NHZ7_9MOLU|nr:valine--tRNA ligase [Mycoplasma todarodis]TCG10808.1 valine--tRNA ligase [Mycoplasma todarodis]
METKYNHKKVEEGKNQEWIDKEIFSKHDKSKEPFTIILPPPNVTGKLHLGHAWDVSLQDAIIRYKKLKGFDTLWLPGMDHAGIATQAKVEVRLQQQGISKHELGRDKFLEKVWEWKDEYASTIREQWGTLGIALDYKKERFTLDKGANDAVNKVFIEMYNKGLIYRGKRAINWDPELQTALSNMEVIGKETESSMWYFKYQIKDSEEFLNVATTRPETMPSDVAVAVHPEDERFKHLVGKTAISPLTGNELPIITDEYIEIDKGTGAMKVSAHAAIDIDIIKANKLEIKESILKDGTMNELAGEFQGIDRMEARIKIVEKLTSEDKVIKTETVMNNVGYSERTGVAVETLVSDQWFVKMAPLAKDLMKDLQGEDGVNFVPERFRNTLERWMENVYDWTISRQLWWGHRIPAWYKDGETKVQVETPGEGWVQDEDVLDTWFSSGIAPFSFLGWPNSMEDVKRYYPTNVLVTGYDIIFFWVARMYFQGLEFMGEKPFKDVLIHGLIRDEQGRKMSKSLGNGIDPMETIEKYGADALRWFLLTNSAPGNDINYSPQKLEAAWNLNNKLWNISRYILEVMEHSTDEITDADKWILDKLSVLEKQVSIRMDKYEFTIVGKDIYNFIQNDFSSWYIEMTKAQPNKKVAEDVLRKTLIIIAPLLPFISEEIWSKFNEGTIFEQEWPTIETEKADYIDDVIEVVKSIREFRVIHNLPNSQEVNYSTTKDINEKTKLFISKLANASYELNDDALFNLKDFDINIKMTDEMKEAEKQRIAQEIKRLQGEIKRSEGMLGNERFVNNASPEKVQIEKDKYEKYKKELETLMNL